MSLHVDLRGPSILLEVRFYLDHNGTRAVLLEMREGGGGGAGERKRESHNETKRNGNQVGPLSDQT